MRVGVWLDGVRAEAIAVATGIAGMVGAFLCDRAYFALVENVGYNRWAWIALPLGVVTIIGGLTGGAIAARRNHIRQTLPRQTIKAR